MTRDQFNQLLRYLESDYPEYLGKYGRNFAFSDSGLHFFPPATMTDDENKELDNIIGEWATKNQIDTNSFEQ